MSSLKQFITLMQMRKGVMSIHLLHEGFKSGRWVNSYRPLFTSLWLSNVEYLFPVIGRKVVFRLYITCDLDMRLWFVATYGAIEMCFDWLIDWLIKVKTP